MIFRWQSSGASQATLFWWRIGCTDTEKGWTILLMQNDLWHLVDKYVMMIQLCERKVTNLNMLFYSKKSGEVLIICNKKVNLIVITWTNLMYKCFNVETKCGKQLISGLQAFLLSPHSRWAAGRKDPSQVCPSHSYPRNSNQGISAGWPGWSIISTIGR